MALLQWREPSDALFAPHLCCWAPFLLLFSMRKVKPLLCRLQWPGTAAIPPLWWTPIVPLASGSQDCPHSCSWTQQAQAEGHKAAPQALLPHSPAQGTEPANKTCLVAACSEGCHDQKPHLGGFATPSHPLSKPGTRGSSHSRAELGSGPGALKCMRGDKKGCRW